MSKKPTLGGVNHKILNEAIKKWRKSIDDNSEQLDILHLKYVLSIGTVNFSQEKINRLRNLGDDPNDVYCGLRDEGIIFDSWSSSHSLCVTFKGEDRYGFIPQPTRMDAYPLSFILEIVDDANQSDFWQKAWENLSQFIEIEYV